MTIKITISETKLWSFLSQLHLRREHDLSSIKGERTIFVTCNNEGDLQKLNSLIASL